MNVPIFSGKRSRSAGWALPLALVALLLFGSAVAFAETTIHPLPPLVEADTVMQAPKGGWKQTPIG